MNLSGKTRVAGVVGWPVSHSLSPRLHNYWLKENGIDGVYIPLAVNPENITSVVKSLPKLGFAGVNLTVPHKEKGMMLVDSVDELAERVGAINTIVVTKDGFLEGKNTDVFGFKEALNQNTRTTNIKNGVSVVIGAGGASRAVVVALLELGVREIRIINRTLEKAELLATGIGPILRPVLWKERNDALSGASFLVNTTTLGMENQLPLDLSLDALPKTAVVNDIVYRPLFTPLLSEAKKRGNPVVDGLWMLMQQGRPGFAAWFGCDPVVSPKLRAHVLGMV